MIRNGAESIDEISHKYLGRPYPNFSGGPETRVIVTIDSQMTRLLCLSVL